MIYLTEVRKGLIGRWQQRARDYFSPRGNGKGTPTPFLTVALNLPNHYVRTAEMLPSSDEPSKYVPTHKPTTTATSTAPPSPHKSINRLDAVIRMQQSPPHKLFRVEDAASRFSCDSPKHLTAPPSLLVCRQTTIRPCMTREHAPPPSPTRALYRQSCASPHFAAPVHGCI